MRQDGARVRVWVVVSARRELLCNGCISCDTERDVWSLVVQLLTIISLWEWLRVIGFMDVNVGTKMLQIR